MSTMEFFGRENAVYADCAENLPPIEVFSIEKQKRRLVTASDNYIEITKQALSSSAALLPYFAEKYNISANINDYVIVPVIIMPSDLPNRNGIGFPYEELVSANVEAGSLAYQTWKMKPTHIDHKNDDYTKAKGIILESSLRPIRGSKGRNGTPLYKVVTLGAFDRYRDPKLANAILTGERDTYSMGAMTSYFTCSICGAKHSKSNTHACDHVSLERPKMSVVNGQVAYLKAHEILGFELSSVGIPAFSSAQTPKENILKL